ncbi:hypothetical protein AYI70_g4038 [Smittium culicis]|uniref:Uncharacterized protein n=1 Tax=Smittium culicis TaxID=133412 RepID=A0A1R1Y0T7_9FUNG|nr:hypothetical protein AYI70_g4038 [Smittium culicis]
MFRNLENYIGEDSRNRVTDLNILPTNQHSPTGNVRTVSTESGRFPEPNNSANRIVNIRPKIHVAERYFRSPRIGPVRLQKEQEAGSILQLFPDTRAAGNKSQNLDWSWWKSPYACTPWNLISQVAQKVRRELLTVTLIAPL